MPLITGTNDADTLNGTEFDDVIDALDGADTVLGLGGNDTINGGAGDDVLRGDGGSAYTGPSGNDTLNGGDGNDYMNGGAGVDTFDGGAGNDRVSFYHLAATQGVIANLMTQTISNDGFGNAETMISVERLGDGTAFADTFIGSDGNNLFLASTGDTVIANGGTDIINMAGAAATIDGGAGFDILQLTGDLSGVLVPDTNGDGLAEVVEMTEGYTVDLRFGQISDGLGNFGFVANIEEVDGSELADAIFGDNLDNVLAGWGGDDIVFGFGGDDVVDGGDGNDQLRGDGTSSYNGPSGNDQLFGGAGDDFMNGGAGVDTFDGGDGADRVSFYNRAATQGAIANLFTQTITNDGFGNAETMISVEGLGSGTAFADQLTGDDGANFMYAGFGDTILTNGGDDTIQVDSAALSLDGGAGIDTAQFVGDVNGMLTPDSTGDGLAEIVFATSGINVNLRSNAIFDDGFGHFGQILNIENVDGTLLDDVIQGSDGNNILNGLAGADLIRGLGGDDIVSGGDGDDNLAGDGASNYNGPSGNDTISGGAGNDLMRGGAGVDSFDGGEGDDDRVSFYSPWATQAVVASLITQTISNDGFGNAETMTGVEGLGAGTVFADTFIGNDVANTLLGDTGDIVTANGGDDNIFIAGAPATVDGGAGVDTLSLSQTLSLQPDNNGDGAAEEVEATAGYVVNLQIGALQDGWGGTGAITNVENVNGSEFADTITGDGNDNMVIAGGGNDVVLGLGGNDILDGGDGNDQLRGDGGPTYTGPSGNDTLSGGAGNDIMWGGAGVDSFDGGAGTDRVSFYALNATQGAVVNLITQTISNDGFGNAETMVGIENLGSGTAFADSFTGDDNANFIMAGYGDTVYGNGGDDQIWIDSAPAVADGGAGNDTIGFVGDTSGMLVADTNGDGLAEVVLATVGVYVDLQAGYVFDDGFGHEVAISGFENVDGSELGDTIIGDGSQNWLNGWGGDDVILGLGGDDIISGGEGSDQLRGDGGSSGLGPFGNDQIFGEGGDDYMNGGAGIDYFDGGDGADRVSFYNRSATQAAVASLVTQTISNDGFGNAETMVSVEGLGAGTQFADQFTGDDANNFMYAGLGDTVLTNGGDDIIQVDSAALLLDGGAGIDTIQFVGDVNGMLQADGNGDGLADVVFATSGVQVSLRSNAIFDDGFGNFGQIFNIENVDGSLLDDVIQGNDNANVLQGLDGADLIYGYGGDDILDGGAGDDFLRDGPSNYAGPSGNDTLRGGAGNDYMNGGAGIDSFDGGEGTDRVSFYSLAATQGVVANLITQIISNDGFGNAETMVSVEGLGDGTAFADTFIGNDGANLILASTGDTVQANGGDDTFQLSGAAASLDGGAGIDSILQFTGDTQGRLQVDNNGDGLAQIIFATQGVNVDLRNNRINNDGFGGTGVITNVENVGGSTLNDTIFGNDGVNNTLSGFDGNDVLSGYGGNDTLNGGAGNDTLNGGSGNDTATYVDETDAMFVDLASGTARRGSAVSAIEDTLTQIENITGGAGDDVLTGNNAVNILAGGAGNDIIRGAGAADTLRGDAGNDTFIYAIGDGADLIDGGADADTVNILGTAANNSLSVTFDGTSITTFASSNVVNVETINAELGDGVDTLTYAGATTDLVVNLETGAASGFGFVSGIENVVGGSGADTFVGSAAVNRFTGGAGNDTYFAGVGDTVVEGAGGGVDIVYASGASFALGANVENLTYVGSAAFTGSGNSLANVIVGGDFGATLDGGGGNDTLTGGIGVDVLNGGAGNDRLVGGAGNDAMNGGTNDDVFVFSAGGGSDTITGFDANPTGGQDLLDLTAYGINATNFAARVSIIDLGADTQITIDGSDVITLLGVNGAGANIITQNDFIIGGG